jgi:alkaline phosphatase
MPLRANRRDFFRIAGASAAGAALLAGADSPIFAQSASAKPRRIIFMVSDGMSTSVVSMADRFSQIVRKEGTHFRRLLDSRKAARGFFETHSLNSLVTDSAAAASAWGSGSRVFNGAINTLPDGRRMEPILPLVKAAGFGTGLVTTATATHATPAGFAAAQASRGDEADIAPQYKDRVDVIMGGGRAFFPPMLRDEFRASGYQVWSRRAEALKEPAPARILGLFGADRDHLPYTIDHMNDAKMKEEIPTLAEMTRVALASLHTSAPQGFLLQVEGARIDHAAHGNDAAALLWDQLAFDDALGAALEFAARAGDTLIVVTSDHGNSSPSLNGMNDGYLDSTPFFARLAKAKGSYGAVRRRATSGGAPTPEGMAAAVKDTLGIELTPEETAQVIAAATDRPVPEINTQHRRFAGIMGQVIGNHTGIGWTGTTHTEEFTVIAAAGPGQDAFDGVLLNTEAFAIMADAFGISHRNPSMTEEDARPYMSEEKATAFLAQERERPHWA